MTNEQLLNIARIGNATLTLQAVSLCKEKLDENPFKEKWYRVQVSDAMDMEFAILMETSVFPIYLDISKCTDVKRMVYELMSSKDDTISFYWMLMGEKWRENIKEYGYFGDDFRMYEHIRVNRRFVPRDYAGLMDVEKALETLELIGHKE